MLFSKLISGTAIRACVEISLFVMPTICSRWETDTKSTSPKGGCIGGRRDEGWKEVVRKSSVQTISTVEPG